MLAADKELGISQAKFHHPRKLHILLLSKARNNSGTSGTETKSRMNIRSQKES